MRSRVAVASVWTTGHPTPVSARTVPQVYIQYVPLFTSNYFMWIKQ